MLKNLSISSVIARTTDLQMLWWQDKRQRVQNSLNSGNHQVYHILSNKNAQLSKYA